PQPGDHDNGGEDNNENGGEDLMVEDPQEGEHYEIDNNVLENLPQLGEHFDAEHGIALPNNEEPYERNRGEEIPEIEEISMREIVRRRRNIVDIIRTGPSYGMNPTAVAIQAQGRGIRNDRIYKRIINDLIEESVIIRFPFVIQINRSEEERRLEESEIIRWHANRGPFAGPLHLRANPDEQTAITAYIEDFGNAGVEYRELRRVFHGINERLLKKELHIQIEDGILAQHRNLKIYRR
ncbi:hypothetical protein AVEN_76486-1, partial [Araneus ventricosus]